MTLDWTGSDVGGEFAPASSPLEMTFVGQASAGWLLTLFLGDGTGTAGIVLTGVTDSVGNTYVIDSAVNRPGGGANAYLVHSKLTHDLGLGPGPFDDTITVTWEGGDWPDVSVVGFAFDVTNSDGVGSGVSGLGSGTGSPSIAAPGEVRASPATGGVHRQPVWPRKPSLEGDQILGGAHGGQVRVVGNDGLAGTVSPGDEITVGVDGIDGDLVVAFAVYRDGPVTNDPSLAWEEDFVDPIDRNAFFFASPNNILMAAQVVTSSERLTYNTSSSGINDNGASVIGIYR